MFSVSSPSLTILTSSSHPYLSPCPLVLVTIPSFFYSCYLIFDGGFVHHTSFSPSTPIFMLSSSSDRPSFDIQSPITILSFPLPVSRTCLWIFSTLKSTQLGIPPARCPCSVRANFHSNNTSASRRPARRTIQLPNCNMIYLRRWISDSVCRLSEFSGLASRLHPPISKVVFASLCAHRIPSFASFGLRPYSKQAFISPTAPNPRRTLYGP
ncbi:hypothetical protein C8J57DRAFT_1623308 [Mycena rebaudengoi]|nr:hypothetical protein C8J57DRAFT_1623308 [Mycena rebaudengoi]